MRNRSGTEPVTARSALRLRLLLSSLFLPLFLAGTLLFWYWMTQSAEGDVPSRGSLRALMVICAVLAFLAAVDLVVVLVRRRRPAPRSRSRGTDTGTGTDRDTDTEKDVDGPRRTPRSRR